MKREERNPIVSWVVPSKVLEVFDPLKTMMCEQDPVVTDTLAPADSSEAKYMQSNSTNRTSGWRVEQEQGLPYFEKHATLEQGASSVIDKLWEVPRMFLHNQPSDASLQKTRTSANVSV